MPYLSIDNLQAGYGATRVLDGVSFDVGEAERLCLLGPSGCGKTTTLQVIAGFVTPDSGRVSLAGTDVVRLAPEKRNIGVMFQNYALFPHLSVFDNVAFGLRMRRVPDAEIARRVGGALELVKLAHASDRKPAELSGGEQQRIAFARAVVIKPSLLLLDEPFSNLDARLRHTMRAELLGLLQELRIATIMVTHDQEEAMAIADRIALMRAGRVEQIGTAAELYDQPRSLFVARFVGESNVLPADVLAVDRGSAQLTLPGIGTVASTRANGSVPGDRVTVLVRPQNIHVAPVSDGGSRRDGWNRADAAIEQILFLGHRTEIHVRIGDLHMVAWQQAPLAPELRVGGAAVVEWRPDDTLVIPGDEARNV